MISFTSDVLPLKNQMYRLALRITMNREDAEDIVQETLIKVWNKRDEWDKIDSLEAYGLTVCRNLSLDLIRKQKTDVVELTEGDAPSQTSPIEGIIQRDKVDVVKSIVNDLPEKQRTAIQLRDFEGKSYKEIALILGISEEQVKVNIFRARQTIRKMYDKIDDYGL